MNEKEQYLNFPKCYEHIKNLGPYKKINTINIKLLEECCCMSDQNPDHSFLRYRVYWSVEFIIVNKTNTIPRSIGLLDS